MTNTVDREMFAVKKFSPLAQVAKIQRAKIYLRRIITVTLPAVAKIKHAEIYHAEKKERENFPIYGSRLYDSLVRDHVIVHLGLNVSSSTHNYGCVVDGVNAMAAI